MSLVLQELTVKSSRLKKFNEKSAVDPCTARQHNKNKPFLPYDN